MARALDCDCDWECELETAAAAATAMCSAGRVGAVGDGEVGECAEPGAGAEAAGVV